MKKLIALIFCLAATLAVQAQTAPKSKKVQKQLGQRVEAQVKKSTQQTPQLHPLAKKLAVRVTLSYQVPGDEDYNTQTTYQCSGVIVNSQADIAIRKDCLAAINDLDKNGLSARLTVLMKGLGKYQNPQDENLYDRPFFYQTPDVESRTFSVKQDFILYALPLQEDSEVKQTLANVFTNYKDLTANEVKSILDRAPVMEKNTKDIPMF